MHSPTDLPEPALAWCPFPNRESARRIATQLLDEKLIGCANILGEIEALYEWNGERGKSKEVAVLMKTNANLLSDMTQRLGELHPYDAPAILGWHCDGAHPSTKAWLGTLSQGALA
ncbi:MAG: divalent-cation tolerance protein CutA [Erythrobacter sp.]